MQKLKSQFHIMNRLQIMAVIATGMLIAYAGHVVLTGRSQIETAMTLCRDGIKQKLPTADADDVHLSWSKVSGAYNLLVANVASSATQEADAGYRMICIVHGSHNQGWSTTSDAYSLYKLVLLPR